MGGTGTTGSRSSRTTGMNRSGVGATGGYPGQAAPGMGMQSTATGTTPAGAAGSSFSQRLQGIISRARTVESIAGLSIVWLASQKLTTTMPL